jgi:hypothetical protein
MWDLDQALRIAVPDPDAAEEHAPPEVGETDPALAASANQAGATV